MKRTAAGEVSRTLSPDSKTWSCRLDAHASGRAWPWRHVVRVSGGPRARTGGPSVRSMVYGGPISQPKTESKTDIYSMVSVFFLLVLMICLTFTSKLSLVFPSHRANRILSFSPTGSTCLSPIKHPSVAPVDACSQRQADPIGLAKQLVPTPQGQRPPSFEEGSLVYRVVARLICAGTMTEWSLASNRFFLEKKDESKGSLRKGKRSWDESFQSKMGSCSASSTQFQLEIGSHCTMVATICFPCTVCRQIVTACKEFRSVTCPYLQYEIRYKVLKEFQSVTVTCLQRVAAPTTTTTVQRRRLGYAQAQAALLRPGSPAYLLSVCCTSKDGIILCRYCLVLTTLFLAKMMNFKSNQMSLYCTVNVCKLFIQ